MSVHKTINRKISTSWKPF